MFSCMVLLYSLLSNYLGGPVPLNLGNYKICELQLPEFSCQMLAGNSES